MSRCRNGIGSHPRRTSPKKTMPAPATRFSPSRWADKKRPTTPAEAPSDMKRTENPSTKRTALRRIVRQPVAARRGTKKKSSRPEMQLYRLVPQVSPWIQRLVVLLPAVARSFWICSANLWPSRRCARSNPSPWNIHSVGVGARSSQRTSGPKAKYTSQAGAW